MHLHLSECMYELNETAFTQYYRSRNYELIMFTNPSTRA